MRRRFVAEIWSPHADLLESYGRSNTGRPRPRHDAYLTSLGLAWYLSSCRWLRYFLRAKTKTLEHLHFLHQNYDEELDRLSKLLESPSPVLRVGEAI